MRPQVIFDQKFMHKGAGIKRDAERFHQEFTDANFDIVDFDLKYRKFYEAKFLLFGGNLKVKKQQSPNFFFSPQFSGIVPSTDIHCVWRVHDFFPITNPEWFPFRSRELFRKTISKINTKRSYFLCNSEFTQTKTIEILGIPKSKTEIVYCKSIDLARTKKCGKCEGCANENLQNFALTVGTIEPRKNYQFLINAWSSKNNLSSLDLVVVGSYGWQYKRIPKVHFFSNSTKLKYFGFICDASLSKLYRNAKVFISASFEEGFNIPAYDAKIVGTPMLLSSNRVHCELFKGEGTFFFNPTNQAEFLSKLNAISAFQRNVDRNFTDSDSNTLETLRKWNLI